MSRFSVCPVLILNGDDLDFVNRPGDLRQVFDDVHRMLGFRVRGLGLPAEPTSDTPPPAPLLPGV